MTNDKPSADIAATLQQAIGYHQQGNLDDAEILYRAVLTQSPAHFDALHLLGVIHYQCDRPAVAADLMESALRLSPNALAYSNYGLVLQALGRPADALASYDRALEMNPGYAVAHINRGNALSEIKRFGDALASYDRALRLQPDSTEALYNRGNALLELKRPGEALASFDRALQFKPDYAEAYNNRGNALLDLKRPEEALVSFERSLRLNPGYAEAYSNRAIALLELKRPEEAFAGLERALQIRPDYAEAFYNRGNVLLALKRPTDAIASYERALQYRPDYPDASYNCGQALFDLKRYGEAAESFGRLLALSPHHDYALGTMFHARLCAGDWSDYDATAARLVLAVARGERRSPPLCLLAHSQHSEVQLRCAQTYAVDKFPPAEKPVWMGERYRHDKIRVAYLSADFHGHATTYLTAELYELHDRAQFEVSAISFGPDGKGEMRDRLEHSFDAFIDVRRMSDGEVARLLREREIDIAVDLKGSTADGRPGIFAHRGAPLQAGYLGYPGTMGTNYIDYIIADRHVIAPEHEPFYSEKIARLPDTYQVNDRNRRIAEHTPSRVELGLPMHGFVFCCFNNNWKITPIIFDIWMRLLKQIEGSVLWLLEDNDEASRNLRREVEMRGVVASRLVFVRRTNLPDHLARHGQADLFLDTLPCNAHTTASDALWAGLPVVTCMGESFAARVADSLLYAAGLPELVTQSLKDYEALALALARAPGMLADIKTRLARNRDACPLFDTDRFRRHIEAAYTTMVERHRRGENPAGFDVAAIELPGRP